MNTLSIDEAFMARAIELARRGAGYSGTNPLVGCVLVRGGKIIAEGYYRKFGAPHAEADALKKLENSLRHELRPNEKWKIEDGLTMYVTLEPHNFQGKTPPCTDAIIQSRMICRVVVGVKDPNPNVSGRGLKKLRAAGIRVDVGVLEDECQELIETFAKWILTQWPFVLLKSAITLDGALAMRRGVRSDFSGPESMKRVMELRQIYDAIAVGANTVAIDNPRLTTRGVRRARSPVRVIFDTGLRISYRAQLLKEAGRTIIFTGPNVTEKKVRAVCAASSGVAVIPCPVKDGAVSLGAALSWLGQYDITSLMVEGGGTLASAFLAEGLVDKMIIHIAPFFAKSLNAPKLFQKNFSHLRLENTRWEILGRDVWFTGYSKSL